MMCSEERESPILIGTNDRMRTTLQHNLVSNSKYSIDYSEKMADGLICFNPQTFKVSETIEYPCCWKILPHSMSWCVSCTSDK